MYTGKKNETWAKLNQCLHIREEQNAQESNEQQVGKRGLALPPQELLSEDLEFPASTALRKPL